MRFSLNILFLTALQDNFNNNDVVWNENFYIDSGLKLRNR